MRQTVQSCSPGRNVAVKQCLPCWQSLRALACFAARCSSAVGRGFACVQRVMASLLNLRAFYNTGGFFGRNQAVVYLLVYHGDIFRVFMADTGGICFTKRLRDRMGLRIEGGNDSNEIVKRFRDMACAHRSYLSRIDRQSRTWYTTTRLLACPDGKKRLSQRLMPPLCCSKRDWSLLFCVVALLAGYSQHKTTV